MTIFSRACPRIQTNIHILRQSTLQNPLLHHQRPFSNNPLLQAKKSSPKKPQQQTPSKSISQPTAKSKPSPLPFKPSTRSPINTTGPNTPTAKTASITRSYITQLASASTPTLLYTSSSITFYKITSYIGAAFCFVYTLYQYETVIKHPPPSLPKWVTYAFTGICFFTSSVACYLILGPMRIVSKIYAVPAHLRRGVGGSYVPVGGGGANGVGAGVRAAQRMTGGGGGANLTQPTINLELHLPKLLPEPLTRLLPRSLFSPRIITTTPSSITLNEALSPIILDPSHQSLSEKEREIRKKEKWERNVLSRGFQAFGSGGRLVWESAKRSLSREGFVEVEVENEGFYKVNVNGGWMLAQGGKEGTLDRLCNIRKNKRTGFWVGLTHR